MKTLDTPTRRFLAVCGVCLVLAVAFKLNGSSIFIWKEFLKDKSNSPSLLVSTPKDVRSDEWEVWTPAVLSQARQTPSFPTTNPALGPGKVPLIYNLPTRHYTAFFRPQYWSFFVFDLERAYSVYWNCKVFGLIISIFFLLRLLTGNHFILSLFGSLWLFFSNYIQWWFSCPPMLPEMLTCWALAILCLVHLFSSATPPRRLLCSAGFIFFGINFTLCLYPPFQIPLFYLGLSIVIGLLSENQAARVHHKPAVFYLIGSLALIALLLIPFFRECLPTFQMLSQTSYPGQRRCHGGGLRVLTLFSGWMNPFNTEFHFPDMYQNANVAANFYPLWSGAVVILAYLGYHAKKFRPVALWILAALLILVLFGLVGLPAWFCNFSLLSYSTEERCLLPIGLANILFTVLVLHQIEKTKLALNRRFAIALALCCGVMTTAYLLFAAKFNPKFLSLGNIAFLATLNLSIFALFFLAPTRLFCGALVAIFAATNALVNPVMTGLSPLLQATPRASIEQIRRADPEAKWVVYGDNVFSEFLMAMGVPVLSGLKIVPNLDFYRRIDPEGLYYPIYNRYAFAAFIVAPDRQTVSIHYLGFPAHVVNIHPANPALKTSGVKYVVFRRMVPHPEPEGLQLIASFPDNSIWIYQLL